MVPLIMSGREEVASCQVEEFATHLSLYDDVFQFVERSGTHPVSVSMLEAASSQGQLPPSVFCPISKNADDLSAGQAKVKRKCGRPRNPIPRHKRESHINAEHRRRGKIQDGFRTLKSMVPKYEQATGRDSKADILFKAVDHCKMLQNDINEISLSLEKLKMQRDVLTVDIKTYKTTLPEPSPEVLQQSWSLEQHFNHYLQSCNKYGWVFGVFKTIMRPLFESYKVKVRGDNMADFLRSVADWAAASLNLTELRAVFMTALNDVPGRRQSFEHQCLNTESATNHTLTDGLDVPAVLDNNNNINNNIYNNSSTSSSNNLQCQSFFYQQVTHPTSTEIPGTRSNCGTDADSICPEGFKTECKHNPPATSRNSPIKTHVYAKDAPSYGPINLHDVSGPINLHGVSGVLSESYHNLDHDLHSLKLARTGLDNFNHWSRLHYPPLSYYPHSYHMYQDAYFPTSGHFHDFRKVHPFWGNAPHDLIPERSSSQRLYYPQVYPLADKNHHLEFPIPLKQDVIYPQQSSHARYEASHISEQDFQRLKVPKMCSNESGNSLTSISSLAKQPKETLGEQDKFSQLSPSSDSHLSSSSSSAYLTSPNLLAGRSSDVSFFTSPPASDVSFFHTSPPASAISNFPDQKSITNDSSEFPVNTFPPGYSIGHEISGNLSRKFTDHRNQPSDYFRQSTDQIKQVNESRSEEDVISSDSLLTTDISPQKFDPILLSDMLPNQSTSRGYQPVPSYPDNLSHVPQGTRFPENIPVKSTTKDVSDSILNPDSLLIKQETNPPEPVLDDNMTDTHLPLQSQSSPRRGHWSLPHNLQTGQAINFLTRTVSSENMTPSQTKSNWKPANDAPRNPPFTNIDSPYTSDEFNQVRNNNQMCYFEMAHRELLKSHCRTQGADSVIENPVQWRTIGSQTLKPQNESGYQLTNSPTAVVSYPAVPHSDQFRLSALHYPGKNESERRSVGRKCSQEDRCLEEVPPEEASGRKKMCSWSDEDRPRTSDCQLEPTHLPGLLSLREGAQRF